MAGKRYKQAPPYKDRIRPDIGWAHDGSLKYGEPQELASPPYPVRPEDAATSAGVVVSAGAARWPIEELAITGDVLSGNLGTTYFPKDATYRKSDGADWEALTMSADVLSGELGQTFFPIEATYTTEAGDDFEALTISGDVLSGELGTTFFPLEYENWPIEAITITGDVTSGTLT